MKTVRFVSVLFGLPFFRRADGYPPTADTCSAAIRSCDTARWREQLQLLEEMRRLLEIKTLGLMNLTLLISSNAFGGFPRSILLDESMIY